VKVFLSLQFMADTLIGPVGSEESGGAAEAAWAKVLAHLIAPADAALAPHHFAHTAIKKVLALQVAYVARCCEGAMQMASARIVEKFKHTWETRLTAYRALPDGTPRADAAASAPELLIGFIGCGVIGMGVVRMLLDAGVHPSQLLISTRSPTTPQLSELAARGVWVGFDNRKVAGAVHVLVFATLPSQLQDATREAQETLTQRTLALSVVGGVPSTKLRLMLGTPHALQLRAETELVRDALALHATRSDSAEHRADLSEPLPSSKLVNLATRALLPDARAADALAGAVGASMLHGLELDEEAHPTGERALVSDFGEAGSPAAPAMSETIYDLLSGLDEATGTGTEGTAEEKELLSQIRAHFTSVARRALLGGSVG